MTSTLVHIANMTNLSKEATSKDKSLKTQWLLLTGNEKKADTDKKRNRAGFLEDYTADFTINTTNFPENKLVYANQGNVTLVKDKLRLCYKCAADTSNE